MPQNKPSSKEPSLTRKDVGTDTSVKKKYWRINSKEGTRIEFFPIFEPNEESGDIEARYIEIRVDDKTKFTLNWLDLYMFVYFASNEELRRNLAQRYERNVSLIPYDVTIKVSPEEARAGTAKRRVELPVDELTMAIARNEAFKLFSASKLKDPRSFAWHKPRKH